MEIVQLARLHLIVFKTHFKRAEHATQHDSAVRARKGVRSGVSNPQTVRQVPGTPYSCAREPCKVLVFSGCKSDPATGSLQPAAIGISR